MEALEERPTGPEIVVIPLTEQMEPMDDIDTVEIPADQVPLKIYHSVLSFIGVFPSSQMKKVSSTLTS